MHGIHGYNEKINQPLSKELPPKIETMADLKEYLVQYLFKKLQLDGGQDVEELVRDLADKNSIYAQTLVEEGIRFMEELAILHDISNDTGWAGIGNIRINSETKMKYFDPDTANLSRLLGEDVIPELIVKVKKYLNQ